MEIEICHTDRAARNLFYALGCAAVAYLGVLLYLHY